jgi:hypothetical protein
LFLQTAVVELLSAEEAAVAAVSGALLLVLRESRATVLSVLRVIAV